MIIHIENVYRLNSSKKAVSFTLLLYICTIIQTTVKTTMKKLYLLILVLAMLTGVSAYAAKHLTINGESVEKAVAQITFDGDNVILHFVDETTQTADMETVTIDFDVVNAIDMVNSAFRLNSMVGGTLDISGLETDAVSIYDASGRMVLRSRVSGSDATLDVNHLHGGMYILKAGNQIVKFMKR